MFTCTKSYKDIPFAHRQHYHTGHCSLIHGHNWSITIDFISYELDECGFVIDFGKLRYIDDWINNNLDHSCVLNINDPEVKNIPSNIVKLYLVENCSCEGLAKHLFGIFNKLVMINTNNRVSIKRITIQENSKNWVCYEPN